MAMKGKTNPFIDELASNRTRFSHAWHFLLDTSVHTSPLSGTRALMQKVIEESIAIPNALPLIEMSDLSLNPPMKSLGPSEKWDRTTKGKRSISTCTRRGRLHRMLNCRRKFKINSRVWVA